MKHWCAVILFTLLSAPLIGWQLSKQSLTADSPSDGLSDDQINWLNRLSSLVEAENKQLESHWSKAHSMLGNSVLQQQNGTWLLNKMHRYGMWKNGVPTKISDDSIKELLKLMAPVAPSIVLAQAIHSSDWGRTPQARVANNLFNIRCYTPECGLLDNQLTAHTQWKIFNHPSASVRWYLEKGLTGAEFSEFRSDRFKMLMRGANMPGQWFKPTLPKHIHTTIEEYQLNYWDTVSQ
ncbi:glucosaminidase domain-containing protein [Reinekea marina]|uniref:Glucosaminidase domain-containing protein n=1 Tax=Reinekea marina TaxID=1310421 RepID=A0ABV7WT09_9GAMM|nr:glucosaminidase domain-containing protein [Reinekea marina]MDN3648800.1 glucosaminidase domain-containing protein [Reinekea marina]